jgi:3-dehydro-L-gulonate 2-dehydrogenase
VRETSLSQVFLAMDIAKLQPPEESARTADAIVDSVLTSNPGAVRYPGEQVLKTRAENLALGLPVREELWAGLGRL